MMRCRTPKHATYHTTRTPNSAESAHILVRTVVCTARYEGDLSGGLPWLQVPEAIPFSEPCSKPLGAILY